MVACRVQAAGPGVAPGWILVQLVERFSNFTVCRSSMLSTSVAGLFFVPNCNYLPTSTSFRLKVSRFAIGLIFQGLIWSQLLSLCCDGCLPGQNCLHLASVQGFLSLVENLVNLGADINAQVKMFFTLAFHDRRVACTRL